ncbi:vWA domain-containing protein [Cytobacillus firmus]|uniref:vWA domain-containing protein n=1 Tax=Cytobacillus firmus TaxID=1399 RepID=UPI003000FE5C
MKRALLLIVTIILSAVFLIACSSVEENKDDKKESDQKKSAESVEGAEEEDSEQTVKKFPPVPKSFKESAEYDMTGEFAGEEFSQVAKNKLNELPDINKDSSEEEIEAMEQEIFALFKEDLSLPNVPIDQWEAMKFADPNAGGEDLQVKENYNVAILLDSSGSMGALENGRTRMDLAKEAIQQFVESLPQKANVSLSVYGHVGTGQEKDKEKSCRKVEEVYPLSAYDPAAFTNSLNQFKPAGWTPMAKAVEQVMKDLKEKDGEKNTNIIYLVSDGIETCGGDPVKAMESLGASNLKPVVNIIGYQVDNDGLSQLKEMAMAANGQFVNVQNQQDLKSEFKRTAEMAKVWSEWHEDANAAINSLFNNVQSQLNEWYKTEQEKMNREHKNLQSAVNYLNDQEKIDTDVFLRYDDQYRDYFLTVDQEARDLFLELDSLNRDSFLDNWDEITDRFLENVNK